MRQQVHVFAVPDAVTTSLLRQGYLTMTKGSVKIERGHMVELRSAGAITAGEVVFVNDSIFIVVYLGGIPADS